MTEEIEKNPWAEFESEEFKEKLETIYHEHGYYYSNWDTIQDLIKKFFETKHRELSKSEKNVESLFEEVRRILITVFYLVDTISDGATHREKNQYTNTALQVIRKQIKFFENMKEYGIRNYFNSTSYHYDPLVSSYDLKKEITEKNNKIKMLEARIKQLGDTNA